MTPLCCFENCHFKSGTPIVCLLAEDWNQLTTFLNTKLSVHATKLEVRRCKFEYTSGSIIMLQHPSEGMLLPCETIVESCSFVKCDCAIDVADPLCILSVSNCHIKDCDEDALDLRRVRSFILSATTIINGLRGIWVAPKCGCQEVRVKRRVREGERERERGEKKREEGRE